MDSESIIVLSRVDLKSTIKKRPRLNTELDQSTSHSLTFEKCKHGSFKSQPTMNADGKKLANNGGKFEAASVDPTLVKLVNSGQKSDDHTVRKRVRGMTKVANMLPFTWWVKDVETTCKESLHALAISDVVQLRADAGSFGSACLAMNINYHGFCLSEAHQAILLDIADLQSLFRR